MTQMERLVVQSLSRVRLFATPWTAACQASLSITNSRRLPKFMSIESVMPSNHLILCHPLLLLPSIFPRIRAFPRRGLNDRKFSPCSGGWKSRLRCLQVHFFWGLSPGLVDSSPVDVFSHGFPLCVYLCWISTCPNLFFFFQKCIYLSFKNVNFGCIGSSLLCAGIL